MIAHASVLARNCSICGMENIFRRPEELNKFVTKTDRRGEFSETIRHPMPWICTCRSGFGGLSVVPAINHCQVSFALQARAVSFILALKQTFPHTHTHIVNEWDIESRINLPRTCAGGQKGAMPEAAAATLTRPRTRKMEVTGTKKSKKSY